MSPAGQRTLVTGGAGFLGSHLCDALIRRGADVLCVDNFHTGTRDNIASLLEHPRFELIAHDVTFPLDVQVERIFNLACPASPVHYQHDPVQTTRTCVHGAMNMLALATQQRARILQASTSEVYGDPEVHPQPESYWGRVNPIGMRSCYNEGKRCAETLFFDYRRQYDLQIKVVRIFNTYGPRMYPDDGRVISNFIVQALRGQDITLYGDGSQTRSFCYVDDLIDALLAAMDTPAEFTGPVNLGNPAELSMLELAELVLRLSGSKSRIVHLPLPPDDPKRRRPDIALASRELGWQPKVPLEEGLKETIAYFRAVLPGLRDTRVAEATAHARLPEQDRDRATDYAESLKRSRDAATQQSKPEQPARHEAPVFFTIASRNYLAYAITLMQSIAQHHPDAPRYLILADRAEDDRAFADAPFTVIPADALALPDFEAFAFRYDIVEFNTAIKPYAFAHLRRLHPGSGMVYLDPDVLLVAPLAQVEAEFARGALAVLTPHLLEPVDDGRHPGEREILGSGTYNCGFVAIGAHADADRLMAWWSDRLEFGAYRDVAAGLFTDQKWIDLVPGLFADVRILRDEGYNLAYWNLSQRPVSRRGLDWYAGERPLAFVHFSGVDPDRPAQFSKHQDRHTQATIGELEPLYADYLARLSANGHAEHRDKPYVFDRFADGEPIRAPVRVVFRRYFDKGTVQPQRHPFAMNRNLYNLPCDELPVRADAPVTRLMYAIWKMRADLRRAFDIDNAAGRDKFIRWFASTAGKEMAIPQRHLDPAQRAVAGRRDRTPQALSVQPPVRNLRSLGLRLINWSCRFRPALRLYAMIPEGIRSGVRRRLERVSRKHKSLPGINLVGYAHGEFGVAEVLRRYAHALQDSGVPFVVRNFEVGIASRQCDISMQRFLSEECRYDVNLFCINADQMPIAREHLGDAVFAGRYNIGCWFWELEKFPEQWHGAIDSVDEIWVTSPFVRDAIAACTQKPVRIVPVALEVNLPESYSRDEFGLAEGAFVFLISFDFNSYATRKNPQGAIAAFRRAFADGRRNVHLVIKTINGERHPDALRSLTDAVAADHRIEVRDGFLDRSGMWGLQACCDCYVSLHRSEGFGLGMAECMLLGKPVVATAYSGNLAFMDADNSCLVGYSLIPVQEGEYPAWQGQHWAEPDIDQAAEYLRRLADEPAYAQRVGKQAQASVRQTLSANASRAAMAARLADIRSIEAHVNR